MKDADSFSEADSGPLVKKLFKFYGIRTYISVIPHIQY
jgi:hypothetical protein